MLRRLCFVWDWQGEKGRYGRTLGSRYSTKAKGYHCRLQLKGSCMAPPFALQRQTEEGRDHMLSFRCKASEKLLVPR